MITATHAMQVAMLGNLKSLLTIGLAVLLLGLASSPLPQVPLPSLSTKPQLVLSL